MAAPDLVEDFFRREYGKLVATLSRRVGIAHLEAVEDAAQSALASALEGWSDSGLPDNPTAWLFRVAHNALMGELRQTTGRRKRLERHGEPLAPTDEPFEGSAFLAGEVGDDLLRMLFVCCDEAIPVESQVVLALKTLCGFSTREIAQRLFTSEANVYKRLERARNKLREESPRLDDLNEAQYSARLPAVHHILYVLFTEGHLSSDAEFAIRQELCDEALRLTAILAGHPSGAAPATFALVALMHLHRARLVARQDADGALLLLHEQDRTLWDSAEIHTGLAWLARAAEGDDFTRYHAEAGVAAEHCLAPSLAETRWDRVVEPVRDPRDGGTLAAASAQPRRRHGRVAGPDGGARRARRIRPADVARRLSSLGRGALRPARTRGRPRDGGPVSSARTRVCAQRCRSRAPRSSARFRRGAWLGPHPRVAGRMRGRVRFA